jgi:ATP-dependent Clp protease ATP-binding subunit ClpA
VEAAKRKFAPEFINRIDKVVVFHPLQRDQLEQILEIELSRVQQRVMETAKGRFLFRVTPAAREFLLREGTDLRYGARHLKRAIERFVVYPLARLVATDQLSLGDILLIDRHSGDEGLAFLRGTEKPSFLAETLLAAPNSRQIPHAEAKVLTAMSIILSGNSFS